MTQQTPAAPPARKAKPGPGWRYRTAVAIRACAAILGGYAVSAAWAAALALLLPAPRVEAALTATMTALVIYPCAAMWCFGARTTRRAIGGLLLAAAPAAAVLLLQGAA